MKIETRIVRSKLSKETLKVINKLEKKSCVICQFDDSCTSYRTKEELKLEVGCSCIDIAVINPNIWLIYNTDSVENISIG